MAVRVTHSSPHLDQEASASQHMYLSYAFHIACQSSWFEQCIQPASSMCIYTWLQSAAVYRVRLSCVASIILAGLCAHSRIRCSELHNCLGPPCQLSTYLCCCMNVHSNEHPKPVGCLAKDMPVMFMFAGKQIVYTSTID